MRNRAKCKLCGDILESFHQHDYVTCSCDEISIDGGQYMFKCGAKDFRNFLRVDDNGKEIEVTLKDKDADNTVTGCDVSDANNSTYNDSASSSGFDTKQPRMDSESYPSKKDLLEELDMMMKNIESLPQNAMTLPINHYDFYSFMLLVSSILRAS